MREYGFTTCSGLPSIAYRGFKDGKPVLDFTTADAQMKLAKDLGFLAVVTYGGGVVGLQRLLPRHERDDGRGLQGLRRVHQGRLPEVQKHADAQRLASRLLQPRRRAARRRPGPRGRERRGLPQGVPQGPAVLHGGQQLHGQRPPATRTSGSPRPCTWPSWNDHDEAGVKLLHEAGSDWAFYNGGNRWTYGAYMYKAAKQFGMKFRISWHWNAVAGDPYYALDCREDDYAWCNASPEGELIPSVEFERLREGLDDYRRLLTLARLAREHADSPAAAAAAADRRPDDGLPPRPARPRRPLSTGGLVGIPPQGG